MKRTGMLVLLAWIVFGAAPQTWGQSGRAERGRQFVRVHCGQCHAIGRTGASPLRLAPPFRDLNRRYHTDDLAESLGEGIVTGHPSMPEIALDAAQINDFMAYLDQLAR